MRPFECHQTVRQLDFVAVDPDSGALVRCKVRLGQLRGFGIEHDPAFTAAGGFTRWVRWGYLATRERRYRVSVRLVRQWQRTWRWELAAKCARVGIRRQGQGTVHRVIDWDFRVLGPTRRGGRWPRSRRQAPEVARREGEIVLRRE